MKRKQGSGSNLNGKLCEKQLILKGKNDSWQSGMLLSSEDQTGNFITNMPMMKTGLKHMKVLQHLHIHCFAPIHPRNTKRRLFENLDRVYSMQSYARSYGFIHGALYASLLYDKGFDFKKIKTDNFDLGNAVKELYNIELPVICRDVAGSLAVNYDIDAINKEEEQRIADIRESIHKQISIFTEKPVVFLELESPYFDFEPEDIHSLDTLGTFIIQ